jgi:AcrR family transcriptional regulator
MDGAVDRLVGDAAPRADARRNVARLVEAARAAVAEVGVTVTAHEIARRAGVGIGTFYRRVPSREALLAAVLHEVLDEITAIADEALADTDPWRGFRTFATRYVALRAESCGITEALGGACADELAGPLATLRRRRRAIVGRAQRAGALRPDVTWQDVAFLLASAATGDRTLGLRARPRQWYRNLDVLLDGLRPPAG